MAQERYSSLHHPIQQKTVFFKNQFPLEIKWDIKVLNHLEIETNANLILMEAIWKRRNKFIYEKVTITIHKEQIIHELKKTQMANKYLKEKQQLHHPIQQKTVFFIEIESTANLIAILMEVIWKRRNKFIHEKVTITIHKEQIIHELKKTQMAVQHLKQLITSINTLYE
ncbi:hypothetical protein ACTFIV_006461 [Dictyostelium citrinum]